jgi:membrane glycosyltransferase
MNYSSVQHSPLGSVSAAQLGAISVPGARLRRVSFFAIVIATTLLGVVMMFDILRANGTTALEAVILALFAITFAWITVAFWGAVIGFVLQLWRRDPLTLRRVAPRPGRGMAIDTRTALVMPIYNEDPQRVLAGLEATCRSLIATGEERHFDAFVLSDTRDAAIAGEEERRVAALQATLGGLMRVHYRRRERNTGRKAGNLADFCTRWGGHYDFMVVLDADSVMEGETLLAMVRAMQASPKTGLIQTVPIPVRQDTLFGRFVQFASCLYSPMLATGLSFWQMDAANYWGHNAIMRTDAFTATCGLPVLKGRPPLGGEILSHDFVEAALLRRGGWEVQLYPYLEGSYEEVPGNLLDYATRDRRWAQGNLQHLKLLHGRGLHPLSRLHFLLGATAYVSSLLWLLMLIVSTIDAVARAVTPNNFFGAAYQLFPDWPIAKPGLIASLLFITICMLLLPKLLGIVLALIQRRREFGGASRLLAGAVLEIVLSVLVAPIMMAFHAYFVVGVLAGYNVAWAPQSREGRTLPWREAFKRTAPATIVGVFWGLIAAWYAPAFFWWLTPILTGLLLAAPLVRWTSSLALGRGLRRAGLLLSPSEVREPEVLEALAAIEGQHRPLPDMPALKALPPEIPREMPIQSLRWRTNTIDRRAA